MSSRQLGPESPRPFAVISENHVRRHVTLPYIPESERYSFGPRYDSKMSELVHKYLELDTNDRLCYVGEPKGSLQDTLRTRFCLLEPITTVLPGHIHYEESPNHRMLPIKIANVGAQDYFQRAAAAGTPTPTFDKVLFKDAVRFMEDPRQTFRDTLKTMSPYGRIVVIQRPADMNTLPVFTDARQRFAASDPGYLQIIRDLQACQLDVQWDVECLPIVMSKAQWYAMLRDRYPPQMEMMSGAEVTSGLRELSEGVLKYGDDLIEFQDRLLFISASRGLFSDTPYISRYGTPAHATNPLPPPADVAMSYEMEVTPEISPYVREREKEQKMSRATRGYGRATNREVK